MTPLKISISKEDMVAMYISREMAQGKIAATLGVSRTTVKNFLARHGIERTEAHDLALRRGVAGRKYASTRTLKPHSEEELRRLILQEKLPIREVAKRLSVGTDTVNRWRRRYGIYLPLEEARRRCALARWAGQRKEVVVAGGYREVFSPEHPKADYQGRVPEHMVLVEGWMGRSLRADEIVHHINMDKLDNSRANLSVLHKSDHAKIHHYYQHVGLFLCGVRESRPGEFRFCRESFWAGAWVSGVSLLP